MVRSPPKVQGKTEANSGIVSILVGQTETVSNRHRCGILFGTQSDLSDKGMGCGFNTV